MVLRRLPFIPATHPQFFGPLHHLLCVATATLGSWLLLHRVSQRGFLVTMSSVVIGMVLFHFAALIRQNILL